MEHIITWLAATQASADIQNIVWVIPVVQSIHILAVSVVMSSVLLLNLRLLGVIGGGEPMDAFTRRYLPWVCVALVVLLATGSILIVGEPGRDLDNRTFWTKMSLLAVAVAITFVLEGPVTRNAKFWEGSPRRHVARLLAVAALGCWIGIVLCGRWIAYTYVS